MLRKCRSNMNMSLSFSEIFGRAKWGGGERKVDRIWMINSMSRCRFHDEDSETPFSNTPHQGFQDTSAITVPRPARTPNEPPKQFESSRSRPIPPMRPCEINSGYPVCSHDRCRRRWKAKGTCPKLEGTRANTMRALVRCFLIGE
jgi:hypothetical protein